MQSNNSGTMKNLSFLLCLFFLVSWLNVFTMFAALQIHRLVLAQIPGHQSSRNPGAQGADGCPKESVRGKAGSCELGVRL